MLPEEPLTYLILGIIVGSLVYGYFQKAMMCNTIVLANFAIFMIYIFMDGAIDPSRALVEDAGFKGSQLVSGDRPYSILTHLYIHGSILHLLMNMLFLMLMGMPFEQKIGPRKFLIIYFGSGIGAALFSGFFYLAMEGRVAFANPDIPGIGASGAIFGVMAAFAYRYPRDKIPMILFIIFLPEVQVYMAVMAYGLIETLYVFAGSVDGIGHMAHVGGLVTGVLLAQLIMKAELLERSRHLNHPLLEQIANTRELRAILVRLKESESDESQDVFLVWLEEWLKKAACPECAAPIEVSGRRMRCRECAFTGDLWLVKKRSEE